MRVVLDTNVLVVDAAIRDEYDDVLRRPECQFPNGRVDDLLAAIDRFAFCAAAVPPNPVPLPDLNDERFLAVAAATGSVLVTGNLRHFPARCRGGVTRSNAS